MDYLAQSSFIWGLLDEADVNGKSSIHIGIIKLADL